MNFSYRFWTQGFCMSQCAPVCPISHASSCESKRGYNSSGTPTLTAWACMHRAQAWMFAGSEPWACKSQERSFQGQGFFLQGKRRNGQDEKEVELKTDEQEHRANTWANVATMKELGVEGVSDLSQPHQHQQSALRALESFDSDIIIHACMWAQGQCLWQKWTLLPASARFYRRHRPRWMKPDQAQASFIYKVHEEQTTWFLTSCLVSEPQCVLMSSTILEELLFMDLPSFGDGRV